jgi:hypothetical protein
MSSAALNVRELRPKPVPVKTGPAITPSVQPPPLPSMRVPKGSVRHDESDADREWTLRAAESKARIAAAEEREWQAQIAKVKAALAASEEDEWSSLRMRSGQATRSAEEREWAELMARARTRSVAAQPSRPRPQRPPRRRPAPTNPLAPAARMQVPAPRVMLWP